MKILIVTILVLTVMASLGSLYLYAQRPGAGAPDYNNPEFAALAKKIDEVAAEVRKANSDTAHRLDQVLSNQEKILSELAIVKVRASMPR